MTVEDQIRDEKLQYDINREASKISALSSGKIDTYEYLTGAEILPYNQHQMIEQAKFTYSPLGKAFEKQKKQLKIKEKNKLMLPLEDLGKEQIEFKSDLGHINQGPRYKKIFRTIKYNKKYQKSL